MKLGAERKELRKVTKQARKRFSQGRRERGGGAKKEENKHDSTFAQIKHVIGVDCISSLYLNRCIKTEHEANTSDDGLLETPSPHG